MRRNKVGQAQRTEFRILALDDDAIMTQTLKSYFEASGFAVDTENDPNAAVERVREGGYDILLLDFLMTPISGDVVVERIRQFDRDIFIILLTGHKSLAPPVRTIRALDIQGYYEKSDRFDQLELLVESCVKSIRQMRTIREYRDGLQELVASMPGVYQIQPLRALSTAVMRILENGLHCGQGFLFLDAGVLAGLRQDFLLGSGSYAFDGTLSREQLAAWLAAHADGKVFRADRLLIAPLQNEQHAVIGLLGAEMTPEDEASTRGALFALFARQTAAAVCNMTLHELLEEQNNALESVNTQLGESYLEVVTAMRALVDAKDLYTRGHSDRVSYYAVRIARAMGRDGAYCERIRVAGLFHDIGKIGVADSILLKATRLTPEEFEVIRRHPAQGERILSAVSLFAPITLIVRHHHERYDGKGYPDGIAGETIPEEARVIAVADSFDAMTSNRRYRSCLTLDAAIAELRKGRGTQFDPAIVDVFLDLLSNYSVMQAELAWTEKSNE